MYGILHGGGAWTRVPRGELERDCSTDVQTGLPLQPEPNVRYLDFPTSG
jgi:hypothetical protein